MDIATEKATLRKQFSSVISSFSEEFVKNADTSFTSHLLSLAAIQNAKNIFCYVSVNKEPSTISFLQSLFAEQKNVYVPQCLPNKTMQAVKITSLQELARGFYGLLEPIQSSPIILPAQLDVIISPCIACSKTGARLGHGGGYYDRYLKQTSCPIVCLCYDALLQETLPIDTFDIPVDTVVTEKQIIFV